MSLATTSWNVLKRTLFRCRPVLMRISESVGELAPVPPANWQRATMQSSPSSSTSQAMEAAGKLAGEYMEHLKKTDLMEFSESEYATFIECVVTGYIEEMQRLGSDKPPF